MAVVLPIVTEYNPKGVEQATKSLKSLVKSQLGVAVSATTLLDLTRRSVSAYNQDAKAQRLLANTLRNTIGASDGLIASVEDQIDKMQNSTLVLDDELRPALSQLVGITKSSTQAFELLQTAIDLSAYSGRDLQSTVDVLSRAYQGQMKGLRGLGVRISDSTLKSKDFAAAMAEIEPIISGANDAINQSAEGSWKRFGVVVANLSEQFGGAITNNVDGYANALAILANETQKSSEEQSLFGKATGWLGNQITTKALGPLKYLNDKLRDVKGSSDDAANSATNFAYSYENFAVTSPRLARALARYEEEQKKAEEASRKAAAANRTRLSDAVKTAREELRALKDTADAYSNSIIDAINANVSLADSVANATMAEQDYTTAVQERAAAYAELNAIQARGVDLRTGSRTAQDAADYANAIERVQRAEAGVTEAQAKRKDYSAQFREQLNAAKEFAGTLQQLIGKGLDKTGLQQLINLGPVAGNQVAKDLLSGTSGLTIADLNLKPLEAAAAGLGTAASDLEFGSQISAAQQTLGQVKQAQTFNITVTSADPDKVVAALVAWAKRNGKLPSIIKTS